MQFTDIIARAARNLRRAKMRTVLTSLAIGVGAFTIALAMAAGNGGRSYLDNMVGAIGDMRTVQVSAVQPDYESINDEKPRKIDEAAPTNDQDFNELTDKDLQKIAAVDGVKKALPVFGVDPLAVEANGSDKYEATVDVQYDGTVIDLSAGHLGDNYEIKPGQIVLPHVYLETFGFKSADSAIDQKVSMEFSDGNGQPFTRQFTIAAVDKEPTSPMAFYQNQFRISNQDGQEIAAKSRPSDQPESYFSIMVVADDNANVDTVKQNIEQAGDYEAMTFAEMRTSVMQVVNIVQYGLMGFGALAILASVFGIVNTQYISVLERTQQIGLMKALGARRKDVARMFRYEAAWIGFLGGALGVGLAFLVTLLNPIMADALELEDDIHLLQMDWLWSVVLIIGLMLVAILSGWFPSRKAAKLDPIEALRTE